MVSLKSFNHCSNCPFYSFNLGFIGHSLKNPFNCSNTWLPLESKSATLPHKLTTFTFLVLLLISVSPSNPYESSYEPYPRHIFLIFGDVQLIYHRRSTSFYHKIPTIPRSTIFVILFSIIVSFVKFSSTKAPPAILSTIVLEFEFRDL